MLNIKELPIIRERVNQMYEPEELDDLYITLEVELLDYLKNNTLDDDNGVVIQKITKGFSTNTNRDLASFYDDLGRYENGIEDYLDSLQQICEIIREHY